MSGRGMRSLQP